MRWIKPSNRPICETTLTFCKAATFAMQTFNIKNLKTDATVENLLAKIWIVATGQAINKDIVDALFAFKNQQDDWSHVGQIVNDHLNARLAGLGGNSSALYRELFKAAGVEYATTTQLNQAIQFYTDRGALDPLSVVISMLLEPQSPHYAPLYQISKTQGVALLTSLGLNNADPLGTLAVAGTAVEDQTLSVMASITDADGIPASGAGALKYQWLANGTAIAGATSSSFKLTQAEVGKQISVKATYTDNGGTTEHVTSTATGAVANVNDVPKGAVTIAGTVMHGQTLTVAHTITDEDGIPTSGAGAMKFQWLANGQAIAGATGTTLALGDAHVGKQISIQASYTDLFGTAESVTSSVTGAVAQQQVVGRFDPVYYNNTNVLTGEKSVIDLRGGFWGAMTFDQYLTNQGIVQHEGNFHTARVWAFDGPVQFANHAIANVSDLPYPYWHIDMGDKTSDTIAPTAAIFDFSGGARTIVLDLSAKRDNMKNWLLFKDFGADDRIKFVTSNPESTAGVTAEEQRMYATNWWGDTREFADFQEFTNYQAFAADGQADAQARYNHYYTGQPLDPNFDKNGVTANVLYLKDQVVSYGDYATRAWDSMTAADRAKVITPENVPATSAGLLLIDSVAFYDNAQSGSTHFYHYIGKGPDGIPDITIGFVGTRPESFDFTGADYQGLMPPVYL